MNKQPFTMGEARIRLKISQPTLYRLINENKLKTYKIGRRRFTTETSINECVETLEKEMGPTSFTVKVAS